MDSKGSLSKMRLFDSVVILCHGILLIAIRLALVVKFIYSNFKNIS